GRLGPRRRGGTTGRRRGTQKAAGTDVTGIAVQSVVVIGMSCKVNHSPARTRRAKSPKTRLVISVLPRRYLSKRRRLRHTYRKPKRRRPNLSPRNTFKRPS